MPVRAIVLLTGLLISLPICLVRPFYGTILWTIFAFLNPQAYVWSSVFAFPWAMAVAIPTLVGLVFFSPGWLNRIWSVEFCLLACLWIWFTITSITSAHTALFMHHSEDTWLRWTFVSKVLLMTVVTMGVVDSFERLRMLVLAIAGSFGFYVLKAFPFMILTGGEFRLYGPENSMVADNNDFGLALNMTLPSFFFLAQSEHRPALRRLFGLLFVITVPAVFFTYSRGALVGLVVVGVLMFVQSKQRWLLVPVMAIAIIAAILFAPDAWKDRMDPTRRDAVDASARSRLNAWTFCFNLATDYPVTGGGFSTFTPELFNRYAPNSTDIHGPHSVYFGLLAEHGFIGLFLYLALIISFFVTIHRLVTVAASEGDQVVVNYANMFRFSVVGFMTSGMFLGRAYFDYFFTIVACAVILKRIYLLHSEDAIPLNFIAEEQLA